MDLYIFLLLILTMTMMAMSIFLYKRRNIPGVVPFIACLLLVGIWNILDAVDLQLHILDAKALWFSIKMAFIIYIPAFWLMTVLELTGKRRFKSFDNLLLLVFPTLTAAIILFSYQSNWFAYDFSLRESGRYHLLSFSKGFWFWMNAGYNYLLNVFSIGHLIKAALSKQYAHKRQAIIILTGMLIPVVSDILMVGHIYPKQNIDTTAVSFCISALLGIYAIFRYDFLNIVLVAREHAFENMDELMLVLDSSKRIVDMNKSALQVFDTSISRVIGMPVSQLIADVAKYDFNVLHEGALKTSLHYTLKGKEVHYYGSLSAIKGDKGDILGYLLLLHDVSELELTQNKLKEANEELKRLNQELYKDSIRDGLTNIYNKKYITLLLQEEMEKAKKAAAHLSAAIIDIDHFKIINDKYGHLVGDSVLKSVAMLLCSALGSDAKIGRFGGEEFLILMKNTTLQEGYELCEKLAQLIRTFQYEHEYVTVTISVGIAEMDCTDDISSLLQKADSCLYRAKENGRNRIEAGAQPLC